MAKVDAHAHIFAPLSDGYPRDVSELAPANRGARAETLLREMDTAAVERAVLVQMGGFGIQHHRYVAETLKRWPDRFAAVGLVDLSDPDPAARLEELRDATGIAGIRLMGDLGNPGLARAEDLPAFPLFHRAGELGLHVNLYCPSEQIDNIEALVAALPAVTFSLDHLGICPATLPTVDTWRRPRFDAEPIPPRTYPRILALARQDNVYVKLSGEYAFSQQPYPFADITPMVAHVYHAFGAARMMWCSDFPWICEEPGYARLTALIDHHLPELTDRERTLVMGANALRVWFGS